MERQLDVIRSVAAGDSDGGAITGLPDAERFGWITAPASTVALVETGARRNLPRSGGALNDLFGELVAALPLDCE